MKIEMLATSSDDKGNVMHAGKVYEVNPKLGEFLTKIQSHGHAYAKRVTDRTVKPVPVSNPAEMDEPAEEVD